MSFAEEHPLALEVPQDEHLVEISVLSSSPVRSETTLDHSRMTHTSILNITEEDSEDEDDEERPRNTSFLLFPEEQKTAPPTPPLSQKCCHSLAATSRTVTRAEKNPLSILDEFTEGLVNSLCLPRHNEEEGIIEHDMLQLLGCLDSPDHAELDKVWKKLRRPLRRHHYRRTSSPTSTIIPRGRSLDHRASSLYQVKEKISPLVDGYESDPEHHATPPIPTPPRPLRRRLHNTTLTLPFHHTWTLTYHSTATRSTPVHVWLERGSLLNQGQTMVEPKLVWCKASRTISATQPYSISLLDICRIVNTKPKLFLARAPCCIMVQTTSQNQQHVWEASSADECVAILTVWKTAVARLAALAVTNDMATMMREFFTPQADGINDIAGLQL